MDLLYIAYVLHVVVGCRVSYVLVHVVCCILYAVLLLFVLLLQMLWRGKSWPFFQCPGLSEMWIAYTLHMFYMLLLGVVCVSSCSMLHVVCCMSFVCSLVVHAVEGEIMTFFPLSWCE